MAKPHPKQEYKKLCEALEKADMYDGRGVYDLYECPVCGKRMWTTYRDKGVTPFIINCECGEYMQHVQSTAQRPKAEVMQWVRPLYSDFCTLNEDMKEHIRMGGLILKGEHYGE